MSDALLFTDSSVDLPADLLEEVGVELLAMPYTLGDVEHPSRSQPEPTIDEFYDALRTGVLSKTAQVRPADCIAAFDKAYASDRAALLLTISSGLSATYDTALAAREAFLEEHPDARIHVIDSLSVSVNQGLLLLKIAERLRDGHSADEVAVWAESNRLRTNAVFTVDSFEYLVRGGRVSPAVGAVGSVLDIKPILKVDREGRLSVLKKTRGRHHALSMLADLVAERIVEPEHQTIVINHAQCPEDAEVLEGLLAERFTAGGVIHGRIGVIIGTHVGPGGLAVSFWGGQARQ